MEESGMQARGEGLQENTVLLMASTIAPFVGMPNNARSDPLVRLADYQTALTRYLSLPEGAPHQILYVDNSGFDLSALRRVAASHNPHGREVTFLSIDPVGAERQSKPYGEMDILDQSLNTLLAGGPRISMVWKVTGRLFVPNLPALARSCPRGAHLYCDLRDVPFVGDRLGGNPWFDMRLWAYAPAFYRDHFFGLKDRLPNIDERSMFETTRGLMASHPGIVPRFGMQPQFQGHLAATDRDYNDFKSNLKNGVRSAARRIAPGLWL